MLKQRFSRLVRAVVGESLTDLEVSHAPALLESEREELQARIARYNQGLALHAAMCERLRADITRIENELAPLAVRVEAQLRTGDRAGAGRSALRREQLSADMARQRQQHEAAERAYRELLEARGTAISAARQKLDGLKRNIDEHSLQNALADLTEMASDLHGGVSASDATIERLEVGLRERRELAMGRLRVARDSMVATGYVESVHLAAENGELALMRYQSEKAPSAGEDDPTALR